MPGSMRRSARSTILPPAIRARSRRCAASACPARCTARRCSDEDGRPLRPAILWNDGRSHAECVALERRCPSLHAIAGNLAMPGFTAPKLLWVAQARAGDLRARRKGAAAEGLCPLSPDRRDGRGHVGRGRHAVARRRPAPLVGPAAARDRARSPPHAAPGRGQRGQRGACAGLRAALGHGERMSWSPAAPATTPRARSGSAPSRRAMPSCRSAPRACCSASRIGLRRRRPRRSTPSATRCPASGTRWA